MRIAQFALLLVVVLDTMGQGLVLPLVTTLILSKEQGILPTETTQAMRELDFGIAIGVFYFAWFLGAAYISKLSDSIGRKNGILICLAGGFGGYALTIVALYTNSFLLLVIGRAISGFTAGNQPIAQAALVDMSRSEEEKTRYMGLVIMALSIGLVIGPILGGVLSDSSLIGDIASLKLPFYVAAVLVLANAILILFFFRDTDVERQPLRVNPIDAFLILWQACSRPLVVKVGLVFFFSQLCLNAVYVFMDSYFFDLFNFGTLENSIAMVILGASLGLAGAFLMGPISARYGRKTVVIGALVVMILAEVGLLFNDSPWLAYVLIIPLFAGFAINYATMLTLFSTSVGASEQGWVMGVSISLFTLGTGTISVVGGSLMAINIHLIFVVAIAAGIVAIALIMLLWRRDVMAKLDPR
ncbi:MAG: MFS transporter [Pseudomonadota bacterium]